jgi:hypothetical protein
VLSKAKPHIDTPLDKTIKIRQRKNKSVKEFFSEKCKYKMAYVLPFCRFCDFYCWEKTILDFSFQVHALTEKNSPNKTIHLFSILLCALGTDIKGVI